jgi:hypothetical protein
MEGLLDNFLATLSALRDVLLFRRLIGTELLIGLYYLGAVIVPFAAWWLGRWVITALRPADGVQGWDGRGAEPMTPTARRRLWALAILLFVVMEIFWRLAFEFGIAYLERALVAGGKSLCGSSHRNPSGRIDRGTRAKVSRDCRLIAGFWDVLGCSRKAVWWPG